MSWKVWDCSESQAGFPQSQRLALQSTLRHCWWKVPATWKADYPCRLTTSRSPPLFVCVLHTCTHTEVLAGGSGKNSCFLQTKCYLLSSSVESMELCIYSKREQDLAQSVSLFHLYCPVNSCHLILLNWKWQSTGNHSKPFPSTDRICSGRFTIVMFLPAF